MVRFLCTYPDVDFVYSDAYEIDAEGKVVGMLWVPPPEWLRVKNRVGGSFMYRRGVYQALGDYDPGAVLAEDYDYWLRVARKFTMQRLFRALYYYRYHSAVADREQRAAARHGTGGAGPAGEQGAGGGGHESEAHHDGRSSDDSREFAVSVVVSTHNRQDDLGRSA